VNAQRSFHDRLKRLQPDAFEVLVAEYEGPLYRMFYCDHRNYHLAQEQTAETFAQLVRSIPTMRGGPEKLRAFVFSVARHVQRRNWRKTKRQQVSIESSAEENICDPSPSPVRNADAREQVERLLDAVGRFEQPVKSIILLRFVEGLSLSEIAEALELPLGTIKSHIHRGRARLKQELGEFQNEQT